MTNHPNRSRKVVLEMTLQEARLLAHGLCAGINDDGIKNIGLTKREQLILGGVGNRLHALARISPGRYYDLTDADR
jgi:hypothetical protein